VARLLLGAGASPLEHNDRGETPLQWAAWGGSKEMVELMLEHGADIHARDTHPYAGWTTLMCAVHQVQPTVSCSGVGMILTCMCQ
jgi:hypothetical protein